MTAMPAKEAKRKGGKKAAKKAKKTRRPTFVLQEQVNGPTPAGDDGAVIVWDSGTYWNETEAPSGEKIDLDEAFEHGHVEFRLNGTKLRGGYSLTRLTETEDGRERWLLVKNSPTG